MDGIDLGELFQVAMIFVVFVLPVLRNIAEKNREGQDREESKRPRPTIQRSPEAGPDVAPQSGTGPVPAKLSEWERLLRGEVIETAPERAARRAGAPAPAAERASGSSPASKSNPGSTPRRGRRPAAEVQRRADRERKPKRRGRVADRKDVTADVGSGMSFDDFSSNFGEPAPTESALEAAGGTVERPMRGQPSSDASRLSAKRSGKSPDRLGEAFGELAARTNVSSAPGVNRLGSTRAARLITDLDRASWRRAILTAELLSPPLALRGHGGGEGGGDGSRGMR